MLLVLLVQINPTWTNNKNGYESKDCFQVVGFLDWWLSASPLAALDVEVSTRKVDTEGITPVQIEAAAEPTTDVWLPSQQPNNKDGQMQLQSRRQL